MNLFKWKKIFRFIVILYTIYLILWFLYWVFWRYCGTEFCLNWLDNNDVLETFVSLILRFLFIMKMNIIIQGIFILIIIIYIVLDILVDKKK